MPAIYGIRNQLQYNCFNFNRLVSNGLVSCWVHYPETAGVGIAPISLIFN